MIAITGFLLKNKKVYLMLGGMLLPAVAGYLIAKSLHGSEGAKNVAFIAGLIAGGFITSRMLKS